MECIQSKGLDFRAKFFGGIAETFGQDRAVPVGPGTSEHTGDFHKNSYPFLFASFFQLKLRYVT